jgi:Flp pilus assembly protein TadD
VPLRQAAALKPDNPDAIYQLALCFAEAGSPVLAREQQRRLLTVDIALARHLGELLGR